MIPYRHDKSWEHIPPKKWWEDLWGLVEIFALIPQWVGLAVLGVSFVMLMGVLSLLAICVSPFAWVAVRVRSWLARDKSRR